MNGSDVVMTEKDGLSTLLDPRTCSCTHMSGRKGVDFASYRQQLREEYVRWGLMTHAHRTRDDVEVVSDEEQVVQVLQRAGLQVADGVFSDDEEDDDYLYWYTIL